MRTEAFYKDNIEDGVVKIYYENGQLKTKMLCKIGEADRIIESYYEDGKIKN